MAATLPLTTGPARLRRSTLNFLAVLCIVGAAIMLGKACWISLKAEVSQVLLHKAFRESIASGTPVKPWFWADTVPVAEVSLSRLGASAIVLQGATGESLAFGPAHLTETPMPGDAGTSVIAAHRDTHFRFLKDARVGDVISVTRNDGLTFRYQVTDMRVADWNATGIDRHAPGHHLIFSTCYPFDAVAHGPERYIVEAEMVN